MGYNCCSHTVEGQDEVWWQVDLQQQYVIETVTIIYRDQGTLKRLAGFEIYLSNTPDWTSGEPCYQDTTANLASMSATQSVTCPGVARYVTIYNNRRVKAYTWYSDQAYLELCEVYVNGCQFGKYGNGNCDNVCTSCAGNRCHPTSGSCDTCAAGSYRAGDHCVQCPQNCAGNTCASTSGACSMGCLAGFSGIYCKCLANCNDQTCDGATGHCSNCYDGFYGPVCTPCPTGCSTHTCDKSTGNCIQCDAGFFGNQCDQFCPANCKANVCNKDSGQCGDCDDGFYGPVCTSCPTGCSTDTCDKSTGNCMQCDAGFFGNQCDQSCPANCTANACNKDSGQCGGRIKVFCKKKKKKNIRRLMKIG
ncbi:scavenger receptor class F member 1-like [Pecten maximus]|uniref:scavenger receptor class F member 1-like n=1 Tax=Pecten maximus TaxID=6579 RepID=UPI0014580214|nr:scavenger receptor class F member 1-like [Pecten maximus]